MKKLFAICLSLGLVVTMSACASSKKVLIIGTSPDYAPYEFINPTDQSVVGADVELMKYIATELGMELKIETASFDDLIPGIQSGKYPVAIAGFTYKEERAAVVDYSDVYYSEGYQGMLIKASDASTLTSVASFDGKNINAQSGSLQESIAKEQLPNAKYTPITQLTDGVQNLLSGKVSGLVISSTAGEQVVANQPSLMLANFQLQADDSGTYVLMTKGQDDLKAKINAAIAKAKAEGLYQQWFDDAKALSLELGV